MLHFKNIIRIQIQCYFQSKTRLRNSVSFNDIHPMACCSHIIHKFSFTNCHISVICDDKTCRYLRIRFFMHVELPSVRGKKSKTTRDSTAFDDLLFEGYQEHFNDFTINYGHNFKLLILEYLSMA